ncbi:MAG: hypothetical protein SGJ17_11805 [Hyphomicrobiales bacterium]|nr:hypothetical protein [Hyphomicrobiales bacterium]
MTRGIVEPPITAVQERFERNAGLWRAFFLLIVAALVAGVVVLVFTVYGAYVALSTYGKTFEDDKTHFKYGSIGAELANGVPYRLLIAMPKAFPEYFADARGQPQGDLSAFGFIYEYDETWPVYETLRSDEKQPRDYRLPIGFAKGVRQSVDVAWFNCAVCHAGKVKVAEEADERIILGMPANTVDLERFFLALFQSAADKRFAWPHLRDEMEKQGPKFSFVEQLMWQWVVIPNTRTGLLERRDQLLPLLRPDQTKRTKAEIAEADSREDYCASKIKSYRDDIQPGEVREKRERGGVKEEVYLSGGYGPPKVNKPDIATAWGPGRVDTFNPYKLIHFDIRAECLSEKERVGAVDFPTVFLQRPRGERGMHLHWDGNNASLKERNLSAAFGAGVTEETVDFASIRKVAAWLGDLQPPPSPYKLDRASVDLGKAVYMKICASCHGYHDGSNYVFEGAKLGQVEDIAYIQTDAGRLDSYTKRMEKYQKEHFFRFRDGGYFSYAVNFLQRRDKNSPWRFLGRETQQFQNFKKTNGYANAPLDGLWLRAPYLHNGSVPTLAALLEPPENRPKTFQRGLTALDVDNGGFIAPNCQPDKTQLTTECYGTVDDGNRPLRGNGGQGHLYGIALAAEQKRDLLAYLKSF